MVSGRQSSRLHWLVSVVGAAWLALAAGCGAPAPRPARSVAPGPEIAVPWRSGREYFVGPGGRASARGTRADPWDIASALAGKHDVRPGDTIWLAGGVYRHPDRQNTSQGWTVGLVGREAAPIIVRAVPGDRVTLDGGLSVGRHATAGFVWLWGLELITSDQEYRAFEPAQNAGLPTGPRGGVEVRNAPGCRLINLIVHGTNGGVALWKGAEGCELYGCLIYGNGYRASDRNHVHGIYTQNRIGRRMISDCIITTPYGHGQLPIQAYGSRRAWVNGYTVSGNILYAPSQRRERLLVGGERDGGIGNVVAGNYCYNVGIQLGYSGVGNRLGVVADNVVYRGRITVQNYLDARVLRNLVVDGRIRADGCGALDEQGNRVYAAGASPREPLVRVLPNRYEAGRAHIVVLNWSGQAHVAVDPSGVLKRGDRYAFRRPEDLFGTPVASGTYAGRPVNVPICGEFGAFCLVREPSRRRQGSAHPIWRVP